MPCEKSRVSQIATVVSFCMVTGLILEDRSKQLIKTQADLNWNKFNSTELCWFTVRQCSNFKGLR
jgi:hypothetical protein